jgi:hypothetical protein
VGGSFGRFLGAAALAVFRGRGFFAAHQAGMFHQTHARAQGEYHPNHQECEYAGTNCLHLANMGKPLYKVNTPNGYK